jgi:hypothetical protein
MDSHVRICICASIPGAELCYLFSAKFGDGSLVFSRCAGRSETAYRLVVAMTIIRREACERFLASLTDLFDVDVVQNRLAILIDILRLIDVFRHNPLDPGTDWSGAIDCHRSAKLVKLKT